MAFQLEGYTPESSLNYKVSYNIPSRDDSRNSVTEILQDLKKDYSKISKSDPYIIQTSFDGFKTSIDNHHPELSLLFAQEYLSRVKHCYSIFEEMDKAIEFGRMATVCSSIPKIKYDFNEKIAVSLNKNLNAHHKDEAGIQTYPKFSVWERLKYNTYVAFDNAGLNKGIQTQSKKLFGQLKHDLCEKPKEHTTEILFDYIEEMNFGESKYANEMIMTYISNIYDTSALRIENNIRFGPEEKFAGVPISKHYDTLEKIRRQVNQVVKKEEENGVSQYAILIKYFGILDASAEAQHNLERLTM